MTHRQVIKQFFNDVKDANKILPIIEENRVVIRLANKRQVMYWQSGWDEITRSVIYPDGQVDEEKFETFGHHDIRTLVKTARMVLKNKGEK